MNWRVISIIAENKLHTFHKTHFVYNESLQHPTMKFCSLRSFFFTLEYSLVPKKTTLSSDRIRRPTRPGKARHFSHQSLVSCLTKHTLRFGKFLYVVSHVAILPSFHGLRWKRLEPWLPIWSAHAKKKKVYHYDWSETASAASGEYIAFPLPSLPCNVVPLFELPIENNILWMDGTGEGCGFFCSLKLPYLNTMSQQCCRRL